MDAMNYLLEVFFLLQFCDVVKVTITDTTQEDLTKFGYKSDMKIIFFLRILLYFGYLLEHHIVEK
jgi:hypothetical protein